MANSGERRMVFDIRGRRKRVVQVTYAILAFLMAASLFFVVGPVNFDSLLGNSSGSSNGSAVFDDQAQRIERQLVRDPNNEALLVQLTRARYNAANSQLQVDPSTGQLTGVPQSALADFNKSGAAWQRYLSTKPKPPDPNIAQLESLAFFYLAATSSSGLDVKTNLAAAQRAQAIYAKAKPSLNSYVVLARYSFLAGDFKGGEAAGKRAESLATGSQRTAVKGAVAQYRNLGAQIQKQIKASAKAQGAAGKQALQNPLGGLSGGGSGLGSSAP